jgi:hypothetical protein
VFVTNQGSFTVNPIDSFVGHIILGNFATDQLVLSEFISEPYARGYDTFDKSNGRSLAGSLRIDGNNYAPKMVWQLNFIVTTAQKDLFEGFLANQSSAPLILVDRWQSSVGGAEVTKVVWVDVDGRYVSAYGVDWLLQLVAREDT